jgi:transcriptional regulator with XRE-family HTH domain
MDIPKKVLGEKIREAREEKGITQKKLGDILRYSPMAISHFENGIRGMKMADIEKMSNYFGKSISFFVQSDTTMFRASRLEDENGEKERIIALESFNKFLNEKGY